MSDMSATESMGNVNRVLIVSAAVGAGHNSVGRAIIAQMQEVAPQVGVEFVDALRFAPRLFRTYYAGGFALGMTRFPRTYGLGYRLTNRPNTASRSLTERCKLRCEQIAMRKFTRYLVAHPVDVVLHVHFLAPPLVRRLRRKGRLSAPQFVVATDIELHRFWYCEDVDHWFVPAECSAAKLKKWGVQPGRITVSGIPIHPKWTQRLDPERILSEWDLPRDKQIVLLSGGTEFTCGPIIKIAKRILSTSQNAYVVVLAGRNKKLLGRLAGLGEVPRRLIGVGFTDRVHELVEVCSLMVTKAGGVTTAECLAKGTPMVLLKPVPGHEGGNALYLEREGAALISHSVSGVAEKVSEVLSDPEMLARLGENAQRLHRPAAQTIADAICHSLKQGRSAAE